VPAFLNVLPSVEISMTPSTMMSSLLLGFPVGTLRVVTVMGSAKLYVHWSPFFPFRLLQNQSPRTQLAALAGVLSPWCGTLVVTVVVGSVQIERSSRISPRESLPPSPSRVSSMVYVAPFVMDFTGSRSRAIRFLPSMFWPSAFAMDFLFSSNSAP